MRFDIGKTLEGKGGRKQVNLSGTFYGTGAHRKVSDRACERPVKVRIARLSGSNKAINIENL